MVGGTAPPAPHHARSALLASDRKLLGCFGLKFRGLGFRVVVV